MPGAGDRAPDTAVDRVGLQLPVQQAEEAGPLLFAAEFHGLGGLLRHGQVQPLEQGLDAVALTCQQSYEVPGQPGDGHRLDVVAGHVAEQEAPPPVTHREQVVEVPADGLALPPGLVDDRRVDARNGGEGRGELPALKCPADARLACVVAGGDHGLGHAPGHVLDEAHDGAGLVGRSRLADQQRAVVPAARDQREGQRRSAGVLVVSEVGPGPWDAGRAQTGGRTVLLQGQAEPADTPFVHVPDTGEPHLAMVRGQPYAAPVGEPGDQQLPGQRGDHVLVQLAGE